MAIGDVFPSETTSFPDAATGRTITRHTGAKASSYPLYYFVPSITSDGRYLVFHSERGGWVQLYRLELGSGEITQITDGSTMDSGWAIWCEPHLRGVWNHLSALEPAAGLLAWFDGERILLTRLDTLESRTAIEMPGRAFIGQSAFSPSGRLLAFIHADARTFRNAIGERECLERMRQFSWTPDHQSWRERVPCEIGVLDTRSGAYRAVVELPFHAHHVLFVSEDLLLFNHVRGDNGMGLVPVGGGPLGRLRPRDERGATCHQLVTRNGICYEAVRTEAGRRRVVLGRCSPDGSARKELAIPDDAYVHTGFDPAGRLVFYESDGAHHAIRIVRADRSGASRVETLRYLPRIPPGQRYQAHPFLSPDRRRLCFTEVVDGYSQVSSMDVGDLVDARESEETDPLEAAPPPA